MADFVHLHVHSEFSLLDGLSKIPKLVLQTKVLGMKHLALTDHGGMYGAIKFYEECKKENINPIIGCEIYIAGSHLKEKETEKGKKTYHLIVLARDFEGYRNLLKLVSIAYLEGFYYRPRVDRETLSKYSKGLIALSGCNSSEVSKALIEGDGEKAKRITSTYNQIFGKENFYLEIQRHLFDQLKTAYDKGTAVYDDLERMANEEKKIITGVKSLSKVYGNAIVATNDIHYVFEEDAQAQDVIVCVQTGKVLSDTKRLRMIDSPTYYLKSSKEMEELFSDLPDAVTNTAKLAQEVKIDLTLGKVAFPNFDVPKGQSADELLREKCFEGINKKKIKITAEIKDRLEYELSVITEKKYATYFLVVADFVNWARESGIVSTTRGSASGSLVSYALGITTVDPLFFKLPFERFLNLYRPTLPDIDVDFADNRRDAVIEFVRDKYGKDKVAQIGTFGTMMARAAVRDVARVMGLPYSKADRIAKMIPFGAQGFHMSLETAKSMNKDLGLLYKQDSEVKDLLDLAQKVEGNARHVSVHAAGVVISPTTLTDFTPLQLENTMQRIITQFDMYDIEKVGLVKMDFLGIRNLSILGEAVEIVKKSRKIKIDLTRLVIDDKKAFDLLAKGETMGLFQLSGSGMTRYLKELRPTTIFDIMAMISLFRPGPMNSIPEFIERKRDAKKVKYFDPRMEEYLKESYGVIVYQDDVLLTAINIAGYSWEEADNFRKAMGKKIPAEMSKQKEKFINGCVKNGMASTKAEQLFKLIEPFAAYGFNKAHAASYAMIAYQTAYMKANFAVEFMAAVMSAESDDADKIASAVAECTKMKIKVLPPDVNDSKVGFAIEKINGSKGIRFGLSAIKNVGKAAIEAIITERKSKGSFKSLDDFVRRVNLRVVNRKTLESLIKAGAMDKFGNRNAMLRILSEIKSAGTSLSKSISTGQGSLFGEKEFDKHDTQNSSITKILQTMPEAPKEELLSWERELLGLYLTEHPLTKVEERLSKLITSKIADLDHFQHAGKTISLGGIISTIRKTFTKIKQEEMCFLKLQDRTSSVEVIVFPRVYSQAKSLLSPDQIVLVTGKLEADDQSLTIIAENITTVEDAEEKVLAEDAALEVAIPKNADRILLSKIYEILRNSPGNLPTFLVLPSENGDAKKMPLPFGTQKTGELESDLKNIGCRIL